MFPSVAVSCADVSCLFTFTITMVAKIRMIAITINSSMSENPLRFVLMSKVETLRVAKMCRHTLENTERAQEARSQEPGARSQNERHTRKYRTNPRRQKPERSKYETNPR